jgi:Ni,Fe-hydrogenase III large subunit
MKARLWFVHKGIERLFEGKDIASGLEIAERISGDTAVGHALAYCQAVEDAHHITVPQGGQSLRCVLLELERLYNHVADVGALCNDVGFGLAQAWALSLREQLLRLNREITGHRLLRGGVVPGGTRVRRLPTVVELAEVGQRFEELVELTASNALVMERFTGTATLDESHAHELGVVGVVGRASGLVFDARVAHPIVDLVDGFTPALHSSGDVLARYAVRVDEVRASLSLLANLVERAGDLDVVASLEGRAVPDQLDGGVGIAEGWRGAIVHRVELDQQQRFTRVKIVDPSFLNWPALPTALGDTIVPDFPLANKSFNLSYAGNDL